MAMESLSSAMTFQTQPKVTAQAQPAKSVNMEVPADGKAVNVDATTAAVTKEQSENGQGENKGNDGRQQSKNSQSASDPLKRAVAEMNKKIGNSNSEAIFGIHEKTDRITIKIVDKDTKEVVKEFPPEKTLDMIAKVWEIAGILVDEKL